MLNALTSCGIKLVGILRHPCIKCW